MASAGHRPSDYLHHSSDCTRTSQLLVASNRFPTRTTLENKKNKKKKQVLGPDSPNPYFKRKSFLKPIPKLRTN